MCVCVFLCARTCASVHNLFVLGWVNKYLQHDLKLESMQVSE
jgi:hypothetical protein